MWHRILLISVCLFPFRLSSPTPQFSLHFAEHVKSKNSLQWKLPRAFFQASVSTETEKNKTVTGRLYFVPRFKWRSCWVESKVNRITTDLRVLRSLRWPFLLQNQRLKHRMVEPDRTQLSDTVTQPWQAKWPTGTDWTLSWCNQKFVLKKKLKKTFRTGVCDTIFGLLGKLGLIIQFSFQ